ncbi:MAG: hypothetical protein KTR17_09345 [Cellvibrionaceae bacterium]|nr:hypothetical protein [Cellvibrionaceae bacterium]
MIDVLAAIAHYLFGWVVFTVSLSWLCAAAYPILQPYIAASTARQGAFHTLLIALFAPLLACITLIILSFPTLAQVLVAPHCHDELCAPHSFDMVVETIISTAALAMAAAAVIIVALMMGSQLMVNRRLAATLEKLSQLRTPGYLRFDSPKRIAWCFGLFRPKVFISSGLLDATNEQQREVILARELARASRYDNLRKWLLDWATLAWPEPSRRIIRGDFALFCDAICDIKAFATLRHTMEMVNFIDTLAHFYDPQTPPSADRYQQRLKQLEREWSTHQQCEHRIIKPQSVLLGAIATFTGIALVAVSVYVGHPLLEVLG